MEKNCTRIEKVMQIDGTDEKKPELVEVHLWFQDCSMEKRNQVEKAVDDCLDLIRDICKPNAN